jgi:cell division septation protein DedD
MKRRARTCPDGAETVKKNSIAYIFWMLFIALVVMAAGAPATNGFAVVNVKLADIYSEANLNSSRLTQALYGEVVDILSERDGWVKVRLFWQRNFNAVTRELSLIEGWTRADNLAFPENRTQDAYTKDVVVLFNDSDEVLVPVSNEGEAPIGPWFEGSLLPRLENSAFNNRVFVLLPDGTTGSVLASNIRQLNADISDNEFGQNMLFHAEKFLGSPVQPNGMSADGIDSSGLVHLAARIAGRILPRDERGISAVLTPKSKERGISELTRGDIVTLRHSEKQETGLSIFIDEDTLLTAVEDTVQYILFEGRDWVAATWLGITHDVVAPGLRTITITNFSTKVIERTITITNYIDVPRQVDTPLAFDEPRRNDEPQTPEVSWVPDILWLLEAAAAAAKATPSGDAPSVAAIQQQQQQIEEPQKSAQVPAAETPQAETPRQDPPRQEAVTQTSPATGARPGPAMYSIHLGSMLRKDTASTLLNSVRNTNLPVYVTISETSAGQFFAIHAGLFTNSASARASLANTPLLSRVARDAAVRPLPADSVPYSPEGRLFGVQVMSVRSLNSALDTMLTLARLGLGPVLRYVPLRDGHFWSVIHCDITPDRNEAARRVRSLDERSQWKPILSSFP